MPSFLNWTLFRCQSAQEIVRYRVVQVFPSRDSLVRLVGAVCCDQNDAWISATNFIDRRTLEPGYEREPLPEEPGGVERVLRSVGEAFDRRLRAA